MAHKFVILVNGQLETYTEWEDIPDVIDNVIEFLPDVPEEERQVDGCEGSTYLWNDRLQELITREQNTK